MITKLTSEQEAQAPRFVEKWLARGLNTDPCDFEAAKVAARAAYRAADLREPEHFFVADCPISAAEMACELRGLKIQKGTVLAALQDQIYGAQDSWLSFYDYLGETVGIKDCKKLRGLIDLSAVCGWWAPYEDFCVFQHRPKAIHRDSQGRLHNTDGPAVKFRGTGKSNVWAIHGVRVDSKIIAREYSVADIEKEENVEVRRVMLDLYGWGRFIADSGLKPVHADDFGTLYCKRIPNDEPLALVKVVNSTQEPDGTFKDYFLRVDPNAYGGLKTARAAVASTWRNADGSFIFASPEDYDPDIQT